uniref:Replicase n=1 Tax=Riverside virus 1 TaxID=1803263 RepID=A0A140D060_9RHAB|nr:large protein [Riverside virus 1]
MYGYGFADIERNELDAFETEVHQIEHETWTSDLWNDSEALMEDPGIMNTSPQYMNNQDYTLNSPLICDELDAFKDYLVHNRDSKLYHTKSWDARVTWMKKLKVDWSNVKNTMAYHKECAELWSQESVRTQEFLDIIKKSDNGARETYTVLGTFLKGWTQKDYPYQGRLTNSGETIKYGTYMWEMIKISWILNATTEYERDHLSVSVGFSYLDPANKRGGILYKSSVLGNVYIGDGIVYLKRINMIWDRNMLLMFKDTSTARFHTLFAIQHRYQDIYHKDHLSAIERMYQLGDMLLKYDTKSAYEAYGMIEPLSSLKLSELAGTFRPLIPAFPHFRNHVETKISDLSRINPSVKPFFAHLSTLTDKRILLTVYGSFRHWGHPFIDYLTGLESLHQNVTSTKENIDKEYAELLASDLAFKILKKEFWNKYRWFVDGSLMDDTDPLKEHVLNNTWPSLDILLNYPPIWHKLPLKPCWDIPEVVDPSIIYSDKTHSIKKSELMTHLRKNPNSPIPTKKVLDTLLSTKSTNWPEFLKEINEKGLDDDDLVIGLKAKEREIKWKGRFFALMSWRLREYFVFTEYLIKKNVIPLFKGLTMADDQTTLIKKMLTNTVGQGGNDYKSVTIANHIDYEKWNNFQRYDSTAPVFLVLGKFFGLPNLFVRTHEFFQNSLIYYRDRPDLMMLKDGQVVNKYPNKRVCWNGQAGGLEGLRQKGWSVLNLLVIERESRIRNTLVQTLAQGDNQVICTQYAINPSKEDGTLRSNIEAAVQNNDVIINAIRKATARIGLRINEDETLQAADLLIYGKTIVFRGNLTCLEEKRYSRITCTTNDQLPSLGNVLATVSTNCLTIAHYSKSPINAMISYNWLGNFVLTILNVHNPALRTRPGLLVNKPKELDSREFKIAALYLDPSLGGIAGMSLTRFHLRMFPDPVTEGLTFWKLIHQHSKDIGIQKLAIKFGNPKLMQYKTKHFEKLVEDPASLNLPRGLSAQNLIKEEIKRTLLNRPHLIRHEVIRDAVTYVKKSEAQFMKFLEGIKPCFPRFLSEFRASTYFGLTSSILGLFVNSKTIRNIFKNFFRPMVDKAILQCELGSIESLIDRINQKAGKIWKCSAAQADELRLKSRNRTIIGTTVPHPAELISNVQSGGINCTGCKEPHPQSVQLTVLVPQGLQGPEDCRGPYHPYLGSSTGETTSLIQSWEKDTDISFLRKASHMRRSFHWFVDPSNKLGKSINKNLKSMTGEDPGDTISGFKRTGSALHRFGCSRVSSGGYIANSPVYGSRMIISTDGFQLLGDTNYDFMYQSLMLYAQQTVGELHKESSDSGTYHFHIGCPSCLRIIDEPQLDSATEYDFPDVSVRLSKWKVSDTPWMNDAVGIEIPEGDWNALSLSDQSKEVGILQGVIFGNLGQSYADTNVLNGLFPLALRNKVHGPSYLAGIRDGLYRAASVDATHRRLFYKAASPCDVVRACYVTLVNNISNHNDFLTFTQADAIVHTLKSFSHRVPPSYPLNNTDLGVMVKTFLLNFTYPQWRAMNFATSPKLWIFADFVSVQLSGVLIIAHSLSNKLKDCHLPDFKQKCKILSDLLGGVRSGEMTTEVQNIVGSRGDIFLCTQEVRHAIKYGAKADLRPKIRQAPPVFSNEVHVRVIETVVEFSIVEEDQPLIQVPRIQNPLISGMRIPQIATGAFLKVEALLNHLKLRPIDALVGGDGSGGIGSLVLRKYDWTRLIFNSLLDMDNVDLGGSLPRPPSAIDYMPDSVKSRCVNFEKAWENPMDLSKPSTWRSFKGLKHKHGLRINLAIFDMEVRDDKMSSDIEDLMAKHLPSLMEVNSTVIVKTYVQRLLSKNSVLLKLGSLFHSSVVTQNDLSSSHTSEVYVVFQSFRIKEIVQLYPMWITLTNRLMKSFCFNSYDQEFARASLMYRVDLVTGIPALFLPDPVCELSSIWNTMAHDKISTARWTSLVSEGKNSMQSFVMSTLALIGNQVLQTTKWSDTSFISIPGDQDLSRFFAYYIGTHLYLALTLQKPDLGKWCQYMIDEPFLIYFYQEMHTPRNSHSNAVHSLGWSIHEREGWVTKKKIFVQHKMALMGSVIRYLSHITKSPGLARQDYWDTRLTGLNRNLTRRHLLSSTGIYDLIQITP